MHHRKEKPTNLVVRKLKAGKEKRSKKQDKKCFLQIESTMREADVQLENPAAILNQRGSGTRAVATRRQSGNNHREILSATSWKNGGNIGERSKIDSWNLEQRKQLKWQGRID